MPWPPCRRLAATLCAAVAGLGCGERGAKFAADELLHATSGLTAEQSASIEAALEELFGTPNLPKLPTDLPRMVELCEIAALQQAAGPVESHEVGVVQGLYRRHCARCHGVAGNGRGPTARYQAPYPRDFRRGVFKWKETYRDAAPTTADLDRVIEHGVPGTAMPSFRLVSEQERAMLRQYVIYLAIRGQSERLLVEFVADELPAGEPLALKGALRKEIVSELIAPIVEAWTEAPQHVVAAPEPLEGDAAAGRELYHSERAGCAKCHGDAGRGGATAGLDYEVDFDLWTRDRLVLKPSAEVARLLEDDLPVRTSAPRQLVGETPHGGVSAADLFRRLHQGIAGTTMPAVGGAAPGEAGALRDEEVAAIVAYLQTLN